MEFGLFLMGSDFGAVRTSAREAEELGYDLVVFPDHFVHLQPGGNYDPHTLAHESMLLAAAAADATRKIRVGHLVLCNLFRHPALAAQSLMSLDHLSGGRAVAGFGAGWTKVEFDMTGIEFPDIAARLRMLDESLTCVRSLWTRERTTFIGEFYRLQDAIMWPKPVQQPHPPIIIGAAGRAALRMAAKHADVVNMGIHTGKAATLTVEAMRELTGDAVRKRAAFVRAEAAAIGRDPHAITISTAIFSVSLAQSSAEAEAAARAIGEMLGVTPKEATRSPLFLIGTPAQCIEELRRRAKEWGVGQFILMAGAIDTTRRLATEVMPHVKAS